LDNGYFSATNIAAMEARNIEPYIATGRIPHQGIRLTRDTVLPQ
jgi:hypothetical protein